MCKRDEADSRTPGSGCAPPSASKQKTSIFLKFHAGGEISFKHKVSYNSSLWESIAKNLKEKSVRMSENEPSELKSSLQALLESSKVSISHQQIAYAHF